MRFSITITEPVRHDDKINKFLESVQHVKFALALYVHVRYNIKISEFPHNVLHIHRDLILKKKVPRPFILLYNSSSTSAVRYIVRVTEFLTSVRYVNCCEYTIRNQYTLQCLD